VKTTWVLVALCLASTARAQDPEAEAPADAEGRGRAPEARSAPVSPRPVAPRLFLAVSLDGLLGSYMLDDPSSPFNVVASNQASGLGVGTDVGVQWTELVGTWARVRSVFGPDPQNQLLQATAMFELTPFEFLSFGGGAGLVFLWHTPNFGPFGPPGVTQLFASGAFPLSVSLNLGTRLNGHRLAFRLSVEGGLYVAGAIFGVSPWGGVTLGAVLF